MASRNEGGLVHLSEWSVDLKARAAASPAADHIPAGQNTLADGISRWPRVELAGKVREKTGSNDWVGQDIARQRIWIFDVVLGTKIICF